MKLLRGFGYFCAALCSPFVLLISAVAFAVEDLFFQLFGTRKAPSRALVRKQSATVVIPNWNGRDLLETHLSSVVEALKEHPNNEIIVVDNASTDGSVEWLRRTFPGVRVLPQTHNLGFGGGSNAGFRAASNDIVVLLNNDMRVEPGFLAPLLEPFADSSVFAVACQIFFSDPSRRREETGLTETWWARGRLRVSHRTDPLIQIPFPCAYAGGGSSAFDRKKFLELGGFDEVLRPFYYEDTDLGHMAWKRGWRVLYQPKSVVFHEHRGTIGRKFTTDFVESTIRKNAILFCWKNIHAWHLLGQHFADTFALCFAGALTGHVQGCYSAVGLVKAFLSLPQAIKSRWQARQLSFISDNEVFRRQRGGYYRDRFHTGDPAPERLQVLFLSPYPIEPPVHGGAVFMKQTLEALARHVDVHLISFVEERKQLAEQESLRNFCASAQFVVRGPRPRRNPASLTPSVVHEFADRDFAWAVHRTMLLEKIDLVQIEYTMMSQYGGEYQHIPCILFEHDISFQSLGRRLQTEKKLGLAVAYMQMLRYELSALRRFTRVQVCSRENAAFLLQFAPELKTRIDPHLRAIIDTRKYRYVAGGRETNTVLFVGSFRHTPNVLALEWFVSRAFASVVARFPEVRLVVAGSGMSSELRNRLQHPNIVPLGFVADVRELLEQHSVLICPILSGSGVRVKLLEAFASGIPVVSTTLGAEGLTERNGDVCELADSPEEFGDAVVRLLENPVYAAGLAERARRMVEQEKDATLVTERLVWTYQGEVDRHRPGPTAQRSSLSEPAVATMAPDNSH